MFVKKYNLYLAEADKEDEAVALTTDGVEEYSFGGGFGGGGGGRAKVGNGNADATPPNTDRQAPPSGRLVDRFQGLLHHPSDARGVKELYLVNSLATPRPKLEKYKYPMPGEEEIRKTELYIYVNASQETHRVKPKWKDESYSNIHWGKTPTSCASSAAIAGPALSNSAR